MGGHLINYMNDTMRRTWESDEKYIYVRYTSHSFRVDLNTIKHSDSKISYCISPNSIYDTIELNVGWTGNMM